VSGVGFGRFGRMPDAAVERACTRCFTGGVGTVFVVVGDALWHAAALHTFAGVPEDQAVNMVDERHESPERRYVASVRLCAACAADTGAPILDEIEASRALAEAAPLTVVLQPDRPGPITGPVTDVEG